MTELKITHEKYTQLCPDSQNSSPYIRLDQVIFLWLSTGPGFAQFQETMRAIRICLSNACIPLCNAYFSLRLHGVSAAWLTQCLSLFWMDTSEFPWWWIVISRSTRHLQIGSSNLRLPTLNGSASNGTIDIPQVPSGPTLRANDGVCVSPPPDEDVQSRDDHIFPRHVIASTADWRWWLLLVRQLCGE